MYPICFKAGDTAKEEIERFFVAMFAVIELFGFDYVSQYFVMCIVQLFCASHYL